MPKGEELLNEINQIKEQASHNIHAADSIATLEKERAIYLGRKSRLTEILRGLKDLSADEKKTIGPLANSMQEQIEKWLTEKAIEINQSRFLDLEKNEKIDITLPGKSRHIGSIHPSRKSLLRMEEIFTSMGFKVEYPYEVDTDYNVFQSVNIPEGHPARDSWDTFWTVDNQIAITHTSSMQNRVLNNNEPPIRVVIPGRTFRHEATDARHEHTFMQVEGVYVDKGINFSHLLGTLKEFFSTFFEKDVDILFSPDYFPFVEPGGMMSLSCVLCDRKGCDVCKGTGWLEILGCGMIHPKVLERGGIDPEVYSGFAWGFGLERVVMLKHDIKDVRLFHQGDLRFIRQF